MEKDKILCAKCPLLASSDFYGPGNNSATAKLTIISEYPLSSSLTEFRDVEILDPLFDKAGVSWDEVYMPYAIKCKITTKAFSKAVLLCKETYLDKELEEYKGEKIVAMGGLTTHSLFRRARALRGSKNNPSLIGHPQRVVPGKLVLFTWSIEDYFKSGGNKQIILDIKRAVLWGLEDTKWET